MSNAYKTSFIQAFECVGASCEDTCCVGWSMQVNDATLARFAQEAPELTHDVVEEHGIKVMKRDEKTGTCVRFAEGLCSIHRDYGTQFLGDACHFFPRITRKLGNTVIMSAALSCPEITRLALLASSPPTLPLSPSAIPERLPQHIINYLPNELIEEDAVAIHQSFIDFVTHHQGKAERKLSILNSVARSLTMIDKKSWKTATPFYLSHAEARLPAPEQHPEDFFNLLHAFVGLVDASPAIGRIRLEQTITEIETALHVTLLRKHGAITTSDKSIDALLKLEHEWKTRWESPLLPLLQRWLSVQIINTLYPFAGFGHNLIDVTTLIGMRFALIKLALMAHCFTHNSPPTNEAIIRIIQGQARFLEHLASPELSIRICQETGWTREARMRSLVGDV